MNIPRHGDRLKRSSTFRIKGQSTTLQGSRPCRNVRLPPWSWNRKPCKGQEGGKGNCIALVVSFPYDVYLSSMLTVCCSATRKESRRKTKRSHNGEARRAQRARAAAILFCLELRPKIAIFFDVPNTIMLVLRTSVFQRATIKPIATLHFLFCLPLIFFRAPVLKSYWIIFNIFRWKA